MMLVFFDLDELLETSNEQIFSNSVLLSQNYPNPVTSQKYLVTIPYALPTSSDVDITVYDSQGNEVCHLAHRFEGAGDHAVKFDTRTLSQGVYYYRLNAGGQSLTKKMAIVK